MRISSKSEYGLRAIFDLAQHYGEGPIQSDAIAARQGIPVNYLNQLLILLRKAGLIDSLRGPQGGHMLARSPDQISIYDALIVLEGPLLLADSARDDLPASQPDDHALIADIWDTVRATLEERLRAVTFDEICQRKRQREGKMMYYI
jgi:Rrf2 family protein